MKDDAEQFLADYWPRSMHPLSPEQQNIVRDIMVAFAYWQKLKQRSKELL